MEKPNVSHCVEENEVHYNQYHDYSKDYLTLESLENDNTFVWESRDGSYSYTGNPISYSLDNGKTWNSLSDGVIATVNSGDKILLKAINSSYSYTGYSGLMLTCGIYSSYSFNAYGNILSMIFGDDFTNTNNKLNGLIFTFKESEIISAENLIMPSEFDTSGSLYRVFYRCESLVTAPSILPATTLPDYCYQNMFGGCTSLVTAPELPATTLANGCYTEMFHGCTSLTTEAQVPNDVTPIAGTYCAYMYCNCPITTPNGNYDELAYQCEQSPK